MNIKCQEQSGPALYQVSITETWYWPRVDLGASKMRCAPTTSLRSNSMPQIFRMLCDGVVRLFETLQRVVHASTANAPNKRQRACRSLVELDDAGGQATAMPMASG